MYKLSIGPSDFHYLTHLKSLFVIGSFWWKWLHYTPFTLSVDVRDVLPSHGHCPWLYLKDRLKILQRELLLHFFIDWDELLLTAYAFINKWSCALHNLSMSNSKNYQVMAPEWTMELFWHELRHYFTDWDQILPMYW